MNKLLSIFLALIMLLSLASCGEEPAPGDNSADVTDENPDETPADTPEEIQESALDILTKIWEALPEDSKPMAFGGDYHEENQVENAPGWHSIETEEDAQSLDTNFGLPAADVSMVSKVACVRHMLNANSFTCSAYEVVKTDVAQTDNVETVAKDLRDGLMNRSYMCGWPEQLDIYTVGSGTVVCFFGNLDLVNAFKDALTEVYGESCAQLYEEDMSEAGGDNTFAIPSDGLPLADSNIGGLLDETPEEGDNLPGGSLLPLDSVPPENEYLRDYFDDMEQLLDGWRDEGKFGINKLGFDLTLPMIDIVIAADSDAEALKNELISMGDYSEEIPYYNEDVIRITIGEHFPADTQ